MPSLSNAITQPAQPFNEFPCGDQKGRNRHSTRSPDAHQLSAGHLYPRNPTNHSDRTDQEYSTLNVHPALQRDSTHHALSAGDIDSFPRCVDRPTDEVEAHNQSCPHDPLTRCNVINWICDDLGDESATDESAALIMSLYDASIASLHEATLRGC